MRRVGGTRDDGTELRAPESHVVSIRTGPNWLDSTYSELSCKDYVHGTLWELSATQDKSVFPLKGSKPPSANFQGYTSNSVVADLCEIELTTDLPWYVEGEPGWNAARPRMVRSFEMIRMRRCATKAISSFHPTPRRLARPVDLMIRRLALCSSHIAALYAPGNSLGSTNGLPNPPTIKQI